MKITRVKVLGAVALAVLALYFFLAATDPRKNLVVVEAGFETTAGGQRTITGKVENRTGRSYSPVVVQIELMNVEGLVVQTTLVNSIAVGAGASWAFGAPVEVVGASRFRVSVSSPENTRPAWLGGS